MLAQSCNSNILARWEIDECTAGNPHTYVEFDPTTVDNCCRLNFSTIHRVHPTDEVNATFKHSCVPGRRANTYGICASGFNQTHFFDEQTNGDGQNYAFRFTVKVPQGESGTLSNFSFWQKAPENTPLTNPTANNYPQKFGIKVTKRLNNGNSSVIFRSIDRPTSRNWEEKNVDFSSISQFKYYEGDEFIFELYAYDPFANGGQMNIWDVTDFKLLGCCAKPVGIGNRLFIDEDGSNTLNSGDTILPNVEVQLFTENQTPNVDSPFQTTISNFNGFYMFESIPEGRYRVFIPKNQAKLQGFGIVPVKGGDNGIDNDNNGYEDFGGFVSDLIDLQSGSEPTIEPSFSNLFTLPDSDVDESVDFGFIRIGSISGNVSGEDKMNGGMKNLSAVTIKLYKKNQANQWVLIDTKETDSNGNYKFDNLLSGQYKVEEQEIISNYDPAKGTDEDEMPDAHDDDGFNQPTDNVIFVTLIQGENEMGNNFKEVLVEALVPVELTHFTVKQQNNDSILKWETATELQNKEFHIQYSNDGFSFRNIGKVNGAGTSTEQNAYQYTHLNSIVNRTNQTLYYRLKQIDENGSFSYSSIQSIKANKGEDILIYPNPVYSQNKLSIWNEDTIHSFVILSSMGLQIHEECNVDSTEFTLDVSSFASGTYFIQFQNGVSSKFIIR